LVLFFEIKKNKNSKVAIFMFGFDCVLKALEE
jgi:hypothetical protein